MRFVPLALALALGGAGTGQAAETRPPPEPETYIFDVLPLQPYKGNFARLVKGNTVPEWVTAISTKGEGTAVPAKTVDIGAQRFRLDHVCKPHDCDGNTLDVLWAPVGQKVWASLVDHGKPPVLLGNPPPPQARVLADPTSAAPAAEAPPRTPAPATPPPATPAQGAPMPEPDTYIFDVLALQPYRGNLARLLKAKGLPDWVSAISIKGEGTAVPGRTVGIAGTSYRLDHVCKPRDCAGNTLDVLWAPGGRKVWALLVSGGKPPVMLGMPPAPEAKALMDAGAPK